MQRTKYKTVTIAWTPEGMEMSYEIQPSKQNTCSTCQHYVKQRGEPGICRSLEKRVDYFWYCASWEGKRDEH